MSKMKFDTHTIEFDDELMNLFKTNDEEFEKDINEKYKFVDENCK